MLLADFHPRFQLVTKTTLVEKPRFSVIDLHNHFGDPLGGYIDRSGKARMVLPHVKCSDWNRFFPLHLTCGRGTFVAPPKLKQGVLRLLEFSDVIRDSGLRPSFELLGQELIEPTPDIAAKLNLSRGESLLWLQRLLRVNNSPMLIETSYISGASFPGLLEKYDGTKGPRDLLIDCCGVQIVRAHETFEPVILEDDEAKQLGVEGGTPALWVEHLAFDLGDAPVAYVTVLIRGDRCRFYTDLTFG